MKLFVDYVKFRDFSYSFHRSAAVRQAVEAAGCHLVYLPDLNPIEQVWSRLKQWVSHAWSLTKQNRRSLGDKAVLYVNLYRLSYVYACHILESQGVAPSLVLLSSL